MKNFLNKLACKLGFHDWDKYNGYYKERVSWNATCQRCGKKNNV